MLLRILFALLIAMLAGLMLIGCSAATEPAPAAQPVSQAATPQPPPAPTNTPLSAPPPAASVAEAATPIVPTQPALPATKESAPAQPQVASRTFQIVAEQSEASYEVTEEFFNRPIGLVNAIGRTNAIEGEFQLNINNSQVQLADNQFKVDLRTLTSDEARRDQRIREQWLESNTYPWAEFRATAIENFPTDAAEGQDISFKLSGNMTVREITQPLTFDVTARLEGNTFSGTAVTSLLMQNYGFEPPSVLGILSVTDGVTVTVKFVAQEADS
jgi:polyisoprenoid-binding protein YceI